MKHFYKQVVECPLTANDCPHALKHRVRGDVPRGFSFQEGTRPEIWVVRKNPGHASDSEKAYYRGKSGVALARAIRQFECGRRKGQIPQEKRSRKFHVNERRYLLYILGCHDRLQPYRGFQVPPEEWRKVEQRAFFTNLFKCSTKDKQANIPRKDFQICYDRYFRQEYALVQPKVILAAGREVYGFLRRKQKAKEVSVPVIYVKHFSYSYAKEEERRALRRMKRKVQKALARGI